MSHLTTQQLAELKADLESMREGIKERLHNSENYGLSDSLRFQTGELSPIDNHPGDLATELYDREKDISLNEHDEFMLERVESALHNIEQGTYGICVKTHQPIPFERLKAVPYTIYTKESSPETVVSNNRPVEEEFLAPAFGRTNLDEHDSQNGFDGEDAWQIVESWGTSNTPAMAEGNEIDSYDVMYQEAFEEMDGFVEPYESFVANDLYGDQVTVYRNRQYRHYLESGEGMGLLEPDYASPDLDSTDTE
ncbi:TraR/DksA C4-type zinc finger protein [Paenibacillus sp. JX-17]|uniref:TraR/DksA C4-type zinc finger protein n=1 Tax=Paenibacillus lacisoli TaxID=3064525 RepID=A0ABT9C827_9BACL|nr:TraR/DksA C4-type zinc finger protein [Paenibacillus sp. JX-17]MDO7905386.1 TraR/DksA C4-type zinc finger protein [Paenibacillus sp. JX-17]